MSETEDKQNNTQTNVNAQSNVNTGLKARRRSDFKKKTSINFQGNTTEDTNRVFNNRYKAPEAESGVYDSSIRLSMSDSDSNFKYDSQMEVEEQIINATDHSKTRDWYNSPNKEEVIPNFKYYGLKQTKPHRYNGGSESSGDGILDTSENPQDNKMHMVTRSIWKDKLSLHNVQRQPKWTNF